MCVGLTQIVTAIAALLILVNIGVLAFHVIEAWREARKERP